MAFLAMNVVASEEEVLTMLEETATLVSSQGIGKISIICDSGTNTYIAPWLEDLTAPCTGHRSCRFGNKG